MNKQEIINEFLKERGRNGGLKTKKKYGKKHYQNMQRKSMEAKRKKALVDKSLATN